MSKRKVSLFGFVDAGKVRDSRDGAITSSPAFSTGVCLPLKLNKHASVCFLPSQYIRSYPGTGVPLTSFASRFGFTFPISR